MYVSTDLANVYRINGSLNVYGHCGCGINKRGFTSGEECGARARAPWSSLKLALIAHQRYSSIAMSACEGRGSTLPIVLQSQPKHGNGLRSTVLAGASRSCRTEAVKYRLREVCVAARNAPRSVRVPFFRRVPRHGFQIRNPLEPGFQIWNPVWNPLEPSPPPLLF